MNADTPNTPTPPENAPTITGPQYWQQAEEMHRAGNREWLPVSEAFWWEMLEVLPPMYCGPYFAVSEAWKDDPETHQPIHLFFRERPSHACRCATFPEIIAELKATRSAGEVRVSR